MLNSYDCSILMFRLGLYLTFNATLSNQDCRALSRAVTEIGGKGGYHKCISTVDGLRDQEQEFVHHKYMTNIPVVVCVPCMVVYVVTIPEQNPSEQTAVAPIVLYRSLE
eukprot:scaffold7316_cov123-Cylindrotheca_fusiformis.AAC.6